MAFLEGSAMAFIVIVVLWFLGKFICDKIWGKCG